MSTILYTTPACQVCEKRSEVPLDAERFEKWKAGELVQDVWPEMNADRREVLVTGTHPECWKKLFGEEGELW